MYIIHKRHRKGIDPYAYTDASVTVLTEDRLRVRATPKIYLPNTDLEGAVHLADEIIANAIDEVCAPGSGGSEVIITFDEKTKVITVQDNGRGFPFNKIFEMCEVLHSTAKTNENKAYSTSGGVHGMGLKLVNYFSDYMIIKSEREGKSIEIKYVDGLRTEVINGKSKDQGTYIEWKVSKRFFSTTDILIEHLLEMITLKSYVTPKAKIIFQATAKNGSTVIKEFKNYSFKDYMKKYNVSTPIVEFDDMFGSDIVKVSFGYDGEMTDGCHITPFTNNIYNKLGGSHVDGLTIAIADFFRVYFDKVYLSEKDKKNDDIKIRLEDCKIGLVAILSVHTEKPSFKSGQHKAILDMNNIKNLMFRSTKKALNALDKPKLKKIADVIHNNIKARMASENTKKRVKQDITNAFSKDKIDEYDAISKRSDADFGELFIIEGKSAKGAMAPVRDNNTQALLAIKGKIENVFDMDVTAVMKEKTGSEFVQNLVKIFGSGVGDKFDLDKCPFDRIYFATDADTDGNEIACQGGMVFFKFFRALVEAGRVYRVVPPLYEIEKGGKRFFVPTNRQFMTLTQKNFVQKHSVYHNGKKFSDAELLDLLIKNERYTESMDILANQHTISSNLAETLIQHKEIGFENSNLEKWKQVIATRFRFIKVEKGDKHIVMYGMINNEFNRFDDAPDFVKDIDKVDIIYPLSGYTIDKPDATPLSLYELLRIFDKYKPKVINRFKGLGEMNKNEMKRTIIPRNTRHSIRLTVEDLEDTYEKLAVMHSKKPQYMKLRKEFMENVEYDIMEIDT